MRFPTLSALTLLFHLPAVMANEPANAVEDYFKAIRTLDAALLSKSIQAPDAYNEQFVRVIDVARRLQSHTDAAAATRWTRQAPHPRVVRHGQQHEDPFHAGQHRCLGGAAEG